MTSRIPQAFIDDLLARTDIVEVIDARVTLRKMGSNYSARCPFHTEKTPSFTVAPTKQFYYCFGCGAHGNAISFLMQYEHLEFIDAIAALAAKAGLEIPLDASSPQESKQNDLYNLLGKVAKYYQVQLRQSQIAIDYLKSRGLSGEIAKRFGIGYAPAAWENLQQQFGRDSQMQSQLITTGMLIKKPDGKSYDRFRGRILFPIRDTRGRVIAFGGRTLGDDLPKYLNSPETPIFHKGNELYGLYEARQANQQLKKIIIVEGYMDVIALAQHEITYAVATLGTATSSKHLQRLFRYSSEILFCFDGDTAGQQAAWRALEVTLPVMNDGLQIGFMFLPNGEDPDSLVRKEGKNAFEQRMTQAVSLSDFLFNHLAQQINLQTADGKARLAKLASDLLNKIPTGIFKQLMFEKLAKLIGIDQSKLQNLIDNKVPSSAQTQHQPQPQKPLKKPSNNLRMQSPIALAISLLLQHPELSSNIADPSPLQSINLPGIDVLIRLLEILRQQPQLTTGALLEYWRDQKPFAQLAKLAMREHMIPAAGLQAEFMDILERIYEINREQSIQTLLTKAKQENLNMDEKKQLQQLLTAEKNKA